MTIEKFKVGLCDVLIEQDEEPENPRRYSSFGTMLCWHRRYTLGDSQPTCPPDEALLSIVPEDFDAEGGAWVRENVASLNLYLYDHSGITISTNEFSCPWDSGWVGYIYCTLDDAHRNFAEEGEPISWSAKSRYRVDSTSAETCTIKDYATYIMKSEVEMYDMYLRGDCYGYVVEIDGQEVHSCWGFCCPFEDVEKEARSSAMRLSSIEEEARKKEEEEAYYWQCRDAVTA